jgi:drug/metabolite transporter superfamily protein YnfA
MVNNVSSKVYTRIARWYSFIYIGYITISSISYLVLSVLGYITDKSTIQVLSSVAIAIAGILAIWGIARDHLAAKWLAVAVYSFNIAVLIQALIHSYSLGRAFSLFNSNIFIALKVFRLFMIIAALIGIILLLQKPSTEENA